MTEQGGSPATPAPDERPDYGLDDDRAAERLAAVLTDVRSAVEGGEADRFEAVTMLGDEVRLLAEEYPDVTDITVRTEILRELNPVFLAAGFERLQPYEF